MANLILGFIVTFVLALVFVILMMAVISLIEPIIYRMMDFADNFFTFMEEKLHGK